MSAARINRVINLLEVLWKKYPNLRLGQILEIVLGYSPEVMLSVRPHNMEDAKVRLIGPALSDIDDEVLENKLKGAVNGSGDV